MDAKTQSDVCTAPVAPSAPPIIASASLRDRAYVWLKQAIAEADIYRSREDIRLEEKELTEALGVSRTPIREAMTLLEREGFLRTVPRRGVYIVRKTKREIIDMIHMWVALESRAAALATLRATDREIAELRQVFHAFHHATPDERIAEYSEANLAFHQGIVQLSKSELICDAMRNIFVHLRAIRTLTLSHNDRAARSMADHMRIIESLENRQTERVEQLVRQHSLDLAVHVEAHCDFLE
jgi:DNA-binding GntR family transcriptional regulator